VRSFSTNSRPALRAASGRPPARRRHDGNRGASLTLTNRRTRPFPDPRLVAAIVDRITFNAHIIETGTQSYRLATSKTSNRKRAS
jgi:hypothetical protein